jgi:hypothetical protein
LKNDEESPFPPPFPCSPPCAAFVGRKLLSSELETLAKAEAEATGAARCDANPSAPKLLRDLRRRRACSWNAETALAAAGPPIWAEVAAATSAEPKAAATSTEKCDDEDDEEEALLLVSSTKSVAEEAQARAPEARPSVAAPAGVASATAAPAPAPAAAAASTEASAAVKVRGAAAA